MPTMRIYSDEGQWDAINKNILGLCELETCSALRAAINRASCSFATASLARMSWLPHTPTQTQLHTSYSLSDTQRTSIAVCAMPKSLVSDFS